ncbi:hypothetical protein D3C81_2159480 [compost metagenome]
MAVKPSVIVMTFSRSVSGATASAGAEPVGPMMYLTLSSEISRLAAVTASLDWYLSSYGMICTL